MDNLSTDLLNMIHKTQGKNSEPSNFRCTGCGMGYEKYPGKYPKTCPTCGGEVRTIVDDHNDSLES
jgi:rRNA maturation endonuclease Nob1